MSNRLLLHQEVLADEVVVYLREALVVLARVTHIGKHLGEGGLAVLLDEFAAVLASLLFGIDVTYILHGVVVICLLVDYSLYGNAVRHRGIALGIAHGERYEWNHPFGQVEHFGYFGCGIGGCAEVAASKSVHLGYGVEFL